MKLDNKIIKALYESQVSGQADADKAKELNQAEQKSFFYIICEYGMYSSNWAYLEQYDKNAKFPFVFADADNLEGDSNFEITRDGELKLASEEDFDGEPITWENLLDSDDRSSSKYEWSMIGFQTFKTRKEAEDLIKYDEKRMEKCARYDLLDSDDRWGDATFNFEVREYTKDDFERDLEDLL
jgi:hypothetical protein